MNNPTTTAIRLTTFFSEYPMSRPPKNPPPTVAAVVVMTSVLKLQSPVDTILEHGCT
jgi:hypothetical protein